jgi:hypothetical protein
MGNMMENYVMMWNYNILLYLLFNWEKACGYVLKMRMFCLIEEDTIMTEMENSLSIRG